MLQWELVQGMDLLDTLNAHGGVLGEPMAAPLFAQLVRAVMFIHSQGMAHRDVKPENCMIEAGTGRWGGGVGHGGGMHDRGPSPPNVLILEFPLPAECRLLLIDFGLSKGMMSACTLGVGTPDYLVRVKRACLDIVAGMRLS